MSTQAVSGRSNVGIGGCKFSVTAPLASLSLVNGLRAAGRHGRLILWLLIPFAVPAWALDPVTLQLKWTHAFQFAGYYAAIEKGFYREAGLDVQLREGQPTLNPVDEVLAGRADFGTGSSSLVLARHAGKPVVVLAAIFQHSPQVLLVPAHRGIQSIQSLADRRLMIESQSEELLAYLQREGLPARRLNLLPHSHTVQELVNGEVEGISAYSSYEPFFLDQQKFPYQIFSPRAAGIDFYGDNLFTRETLISDHPDRVKAFRAASLRGWAYAMENPEELIELIVSRYAPAASREHLRYEAKAMQSLIEPALVDVGYMYPGRWAHIVSVYAELGMLPSEVDLEGFLYDDDPLATQVRRLSQYLALALLCLLVGGGLALYVQRVNRRLTLAMADKTRSEERHRILFQTSPLAGLVWRQDFVITDWNLQAERLFGWTREEVLGRPFTDILLAHVDQASQAPFLDARMQADELLGRLSTHVTRDGESLTCEWFNAWLPVQPGQPREVVSLAYDITQRQAQEAEIDSLNRRLEQRAREADAANRAKSAFLANMSHEIRTPMYAIIGFTSLMRREDLTTRQAERLGHIASAGEHLLALIDNILDFSKIEAGELVLEAVEFDLDEVLRRVALLVAPRVQAKGLELVVDSDVSATLIGDPTRLSQALINYLGNAVKFTERGSIVLRVRTVADDEGSRQLRFEVQDSGIGIPPAQLDGLFAAFKQADTSTTRRFGGTGLGLAITRQIAELMQGEVGIESTPGVGSVFWFSARFGKAPPRIGGVTPPVPGQRALVVDDLAITRTVHARLLERLGLRPVVVSSSLDALPTLLAADADGAPIPLAFIDFRMPEIDGLELIGRIRALPLKQQPTCILVTAAGEPELVEQARAAGYAEVIAKPLGIDRLQAWLQKYREDLSGDAKKADRSDVETLIRDFAGTRLLLVEDEPINQLIGRDMLEELGFLVSVASNGQEAVDKVASEHFDLILTDIQMPILDGPGAVRKIRALPNGCTVPIIALTANAFQEDRERCLAAGMNDFLTKPFEPTVLFGILLKWLRKQPPSA